MDKQDKQNFKDIIKGALYNDIPIHFCAFNQETMRF